MWTSIGNEMKSLNTFTYDEFIKMLYLWHFVIYITLIMGNDYPR
jgi:hypothetical protein